MNKDNEEAINDNSDYISNYVDQILFTSLEKLFRISIFALGSLIICNF